MMKKLRVTLAGQYHPNFVGDQKGKFAKAKKELEDLSSEWNFDLYVYPKEIYNEKDGIEAAHVIKEKKTDLLLLFAAAFPSGTVIEAVAESAPFLGCWAHSEQVGTETLEYNSLCGINMNISILKQYMTGLNKKAKWFFGGKGDKLFEKRLQVTIRALTAIINLSGARIALVGGIAAGFDNQYYDERKIYERFGVKVTRDLEFSDVKNKALGYSCKDITPIIDEMSNNYCEITDIAKTTLEKQARVLKAYQDIAREGNLDAIAGNCWPRFRSEMGMVPCAVIGQLNQEGLPTACEGDVYGALTQLSLKYITKDPSIVVDLINYDFDDDSILLWHCGIGCRQLAKDGSLKLNRQFNPSMVDGKGMQYFAPATEMIFDKMDATVARYSDEGSKLFLITGEFSNPEKHSYAGSRGWLFNLKLNGEPIKAKDLMSTIFAEGLQHHLVVGKGNVSDELLEIATWLDITPVELTKYKNYLQW